MSAREGIKSRYRHGEAFCLMIYRCEKDPNHNELIWNSRDGVTPFVVDCRTCKSAAQHVDWTRDRREHFYLPPPGSRMFVDLSEERAGELAKKKVEASWDAPEYPMKDRFDSKEDAIAHFIKKFLEGRGEPEPDLIEVTEEIQRALRSVGHNIPFSGGRYA